MASTTPDPTVMIVGHTVVGLAKATNTCPRVGGRETAHRRLRRGENALAMPLPE